MLQPASTTLRRNELESERTQVEDVNRLDAPSEAPASNSDYAITTGGRAWQSQAGVINSSASPMPAAPPDDASSRQCRSDRENAVRR